MRDLLRSEAMIALPTIFVAQSILTMAAFAIPVVAPAAAADIGIPTVYVGGFTAVVYLVAMVGGLFAGGLVVRLGTVRVLQMLLLAGAAGTAAFTLGTVSAAIFCAAAIGIATGPMNPAGSYLLARTTPDRWRAFVFSAKQCATPMGGMLAGVVTPPLLLAHGWPTAVAVIAVAALAVVLLIQIPRSRLDTERDPAQPFRAGAFTQPLRIVLGSPALRAVAIMAFIYAGGQISVASYYVVFLTERIEMSIAAAGLLYAIFSGCGIPARLFWGAIAERRLRSRTILVLSGILAAAALALTANFGVGWPLPLLGAVAVLMGTGGNGWVGLLFAETVRLAPDDQAAEASAGAQFFAYGGIMAMPMVFGGIVAATGRYDWAFYLLAVLSLIGALQLAMTRSR